MRTEASAGRVYQLDVSPGGRPEARCRGLQRALFIARAMVAREVGCDMLTAQTGQGSISEGNLGQVGFEHMSSRNVYRFDPASR